MKSDFSSRLIKSPNIMEVYCCLVDKAIIRDVSASKNNMKKCSVLVGSKLLDAERVVFKQNYQ